ncbi:MAG TPA: HD domain-containing protein, partial [Gemmatimonadaceae bacterium]
MAEETLDLRALPKRDAYDTLARHVDAVLAGIDDEVAEMATLSCLLHHAFGHLWTGFYRVVQPGRLLRVGPYQGTLGCLEIRFGAGVCGTAAAELRTVVVEDVQAFPGHITCDARARSEIVVPVRDADGALLAVLDVDSEHPGTFDEEDSAGLERLVARFARQRTTPGADGAPAAGAPTIGYSDRINHALAFTAKHHDQQVRRGLRAPYFTQPANVGLILVRYGQDDETVTAGVLHDVVEDCAREGSASALERVADKFGREVLDALRAVTERRHDDDGVELSSEERRDDLLARLATADDRGRWVAAANALHDVGTLLADLARTEFPEAVWSRRALGRAGTVRWFRQLHDRLAAAGFDAP